MGKPIRARFESLKTETECGQSSLYYAFGVHNSVASSSRRARCSRPLHVVIFIAFKRPYDPVEIVHAIARDIQRTGTSKTQ